MDIKEVLPQKIEGQEGIASWKMDSSVNFPFPFSLSLLPFFKKEDFFGLFTLLGNLFLHLFSKLRNTKIPPTYSKFIK